MSVIQRTRQRKYDNHLVYSYLIIQMVSRVLFLTIIVYIISFGVIEARCPLPVLNAFPLILEYAVWRGWSQALLYTSQLEPGCDWAAVRLVKCLGQNGIASAVDVTNKPNVTSKLGVAVVLPTLHNNETDSFDINIKKLQDSGMIEAWFDWLITARTHNDYKHVHNILNETALRFDANIVVAYPVYKQRLGNRNIGLCDNSFRYKNEENGSINKSIASNNKRYGSKHSKNGYENVRQRSTRFKDLKRNSTYKSGNSYLPLHAAGSVYYNYSRYFNTVNISHLFLNVTSGIDLNLKKKNDDQMFYLVQYFKVRINGSLYASPLGIWDRNLSMSLVQPPHPVEARNFVGEHFRFGSCNSSEEGGEAKDVDTSLFNDVLYFLTDRLNATCYIQYYSKLGFQTYEGTWTGLLGALMDNSIDIALEPVTSHASRNQNMDFVFPLAETMFNIYIREQETTSVRDIFLAPFNPILLGCAFAIFLVSTIVIYIISKFAPSVTNCTSMGFTEALIWSTGILCQQGGTSTPSNPAASILLIVCLLFALVTYNSYAAFITSVLSVRVASVDTVSAVLQSSNLKIGYIRNGPDQMYLMSTKDVQLNAFYIRGYSEAENLVSSAEEGLFRAAKQDYAFFSEQRAARTTLRSLSQARGRCSLRELAVPSTRAHLAFPLSKGSPYARPILVSLLQLRGAGVAARLRTVLVPAMPTCEPPPRFASARAADVRSALLVFLFGVVASIIIGIGEYCWYKRGQLKKYIIGYFKHTKNVFKQLLL